MQHPDDDTTAIIVSASLASDHARLFGPVEDGAKPISTPKNSMDWDTTIDAAGFTITSHTMEISFSREKSDAIKMLLFDQWLLSRNKAKARGVLCMAGKLWNLTYVVRAGRYFVWRLLRLTGFQSSPGSQNQNHTIQLGRQFHAQLFVWRWAINHELLLEGAVLSVPSYTPMKQPAKVHCLSAASVGAVGGFCVERKVFWRQDLPQELTTELQRKADRRDTCTV